ncbi:MAG: hypothetical protein E5V54_24105 [Mesorhizobium sp.]|nr:MAG: hypothetical protein E5V54_24105 [Mesorhizobium sp.]
MKLRAIWSQRYNHWVLCHDQPCEKGETNVVARLYDCDGPAIAERFNIHPRPNRYLELMKEVFEL